MATSSLATQRVATAIDDEFMVQIDWLLSVRGCQNRAGAIRDLARAGLALAAAETAPEHDKAGALVCAYDRTRR